MAQGSRQHILEMGLQGGLGALGALTLVLPAALPPVASSQLWVPWSF